MLCECGCGQETDQAFVRGHDSEALRMLLHLEGVLDHDEPIADFLHRRGYGHNGRNLTREYQARPTAPTCPPGDRPRIQEGQFTDIARRVGRDVLKRPVSVGPEHRNRLRYVLAPAEPGVYVLSEGDRPVFVGRITAWSSTAAPARGSRTWRPRWPGSRPGGCS